jgi:uncharacterized protein (TIGR02271 family)
MASIEKDRVLQFRGQDVHDRDGDKIGSIEEIYLDTDTDRPEWALVHTGLFGTKSTFVPLRDATEADGTLRVPYEKAHIKDAPKIDSDGELSEREESELYRYYDLGYSEARSDSGLPEGGAGTTQQQTRGVVGEDVSGPETDTAMTRSEEEVRVGTAERESGRARLRKHIVTDQVEETVPVRRETARVEREPITDANVDDAMSGGALTEEEHEVVLHEEEPVAEKRVVPKERVRLDKDVEVEERTVAEDVQREEIEIADDGGRRG